MKRFSPWAASASSRGALVSLNRPSPIGIRVPAERVLSVEAATGVPRVRLRPDLYREAAVTEPDDVDAGRAQEYALLASLLSAAPSQELLSALATLRGDATPLGVAHAALADAADQISIADAEREYFDLFVGLGRGELLPYGSYYVAGFLHERPLARLREDLARSASSAPRRRPSRKITLPFSARSWRALPADNSRRSANAQREIFQKHVAPWMGRMFADIERSAAATNFYRHVGTLGRVFLDIEQQAFALAG